MNKKTLALIAMIISIAIAFFGILVMAGSMGGDTSYPSSSYPYDAGYASFGADFYTYVNNNAAEAASGTYTIAANLNDIAELMKNALGIFLIGFGLLGLCHFAMIWVDEKAKAAAAKPAEEEAPTQIPAEVPIQSTEEQEEKISEI